MLLERAGAGRTTVLIVDEAHNLEWDVLEEIRLLGNLENRKQVASDRPRRPAGIGSQVAPRNSASSSNAFPCGAPCGASMLARPWPTWIPAWRAPDSKARRCSHHNCWKRSTTGPKGLPV